jgi:PPK2 family polyphosphate:nucleotide phosphotransferase
LRSELAAFQERLWAEQRQSLLVVLQALDAGGKDGLIRKVVTAFNPQGTRVTGFGVPSAEELRHDYLWRVHAATPGRGRIGVFNRSHYEDVLVPRVHATIDLAECKRRYRQINDFERMLAENGTTLLKFFLHISKAEQRARLQERIDKPEKRWKFNPSDLKERARWDEYLAAYEAAIEETSSEWAPWYVIPSDSKSTRNLIVSSILVETLEGLKMAYPQPAEDYSGIVV